MATKTSTYSLKENWILVVMALTSLLNSVYEWGLGARKKGQRHLNNGTHKKERTN
jgi:hypothetical protein